MKGETYFVLVAKSQCDYVETRIRELGYRPRRILFRKELSTRLPRLDKRLKVKLIRVYLDGHTLLRENRLAPYLENDSCVLEFVTATDIGL